MGLEEDPLQVLLQPNEILNDLEKLAGIIDILLGPLAKKIILSGCGGCGLSYKFTD